MKVYGITLMTALAAWSCKTQNSSNLHSDIPDSNSPQVASVPVPAPPPSEGVTVQQRQAMIANKTLFTRYSVKSKLGWGTSPDKRMEVYIPVDASGAFVPPSSGVNRQIPLEKQAITATGLPIQTPASLTSFLVICNEQGPADDISWAHPDLKDISLHGSTATSPFVHGMRIAEGTCAAMPVASKNLREGTTYDHQQELIHGHILNGGIKVEENNALLQKFKTLTADDFTIYLKLVKINPQGEIVP